MEQIRDNIRRNPVFDFISQNPSNDPVERKLAKAIHSLFLEPINSPREKYRKFLKNFRDAASAHLSFQERNKGVRVSTRASQALLSLSKILYTGTDITEFNSRLTCAISKEGLSKKRISVNASTTRSRGSSQEPWDQFRDQIESLTQIQKGIENNRQINLFRGAAQSVMGGGTYLGFDPNMRGNLISVKARYTNASTGLETIAIRMPTQTINSSKGNTTPSPEFQLYLNALEAENKKHTYINLQNGMEQAKGHLFSMFEDERPRVRVLHGMSDKHKNLIVISLNKNSTFYRQNKDWNRPFTYKEFAEKALDIFVPKNENQLDVEKKFGIVLRDLWNPKKFPGATREQVRKYISELLDRLALSIFDVRDPNQNLGSAERQALIELAYHFISDYATRGSYSSNRSCKEAVDRGAGANALAYTLSFVKEVCDSSIKDPREFKRKLNAIPGMLLSDALQVRKRGIIGERLDYYQDAALRFVDAVQRKGCNSVFNKSGLASFFYLTRPRIGSALASQPQDEHLTQPCTYESSSPPLASNCSGRSDISPILSPVTADTLSSSFELLSDELDVDDQEDTELAQAGIALQGNDFPNTLSTRFEFPPPPMPPFFQQSQPQFFRYPTLPYPSFRGHWTDSYFYNSYFFQNFSY